MRSFKRESKTEPFVVAKAGRAVSGVLLGLLLQVQTADACRYNIREVGFVDLGEGRYRLYGYVGSDTPDDVVNGLERISYAALMDSCVEVEIINIDRQNEHPAIRHLRAAAINSLPAALLIAPDGRMLELPIVQSDRPFKETLWASLDNVLSSPARDELLKHLWKAYAVVMLVECHDPVKNQRATETIRLAIRIIGEHMRLMSKPILDPPVLLIMKRGAFPGEKVLLWNLGLNPNETREPAAVVLYGRARRLGPILIGEDITETRVAAFLSVIGSDCECGLDRQWLTGMGLLIKWDQPVQQRTAEALGFDPEDPAVKAEVRDIVGRRGPGRTQLPEPDVLVDSLFRHGQRAPDVFHVPIP